MTYNKHIWHDNGLIRKEYMDDVEEGISKIKELTGEGFFELCNLFTEYGDLFELSNPAYSTNITYTLEKDKHGYVTGLSATGQIKTSTTIGVQILDKTPIEKFGLSEGMSINCSNMSASSFKGTTGFLVRWYNKDDSVIKQDHLRKLSYLQGSVDYITVPTNAYKMDMLAITFTTLAAGLNPKIYFGFTNPDIQVYKVKDLTKTIDELKQISNEFDKKISSNDKTLEELKVETNLFDYYKDDVLSTNQTINNFQWTFTKDDDGIVKKISLQGTAAKEYQPAVALISNRNISDFMLKPLENIGLYINNVHEWLGRYFMLTLIFNDEERNEIQRDSITDRFFSVQIPENTKSFYIFLTASDSIAAGTSISEDDYCVSNPHISVYRPATVKELFDEKDLEIKNLKSDVNILKSKVSGLESDVGDLQTEVNALKKYLTKINDLEAAVAELQGYLTAVPNGG